MEEWVERALKRWPNVPALYGWLKLDRRGRWHIKGELISRLQIVDVINRNYSKDERGGWYFQNGPQRGYLQLERAPMILHVESDALRTHSQLAVTRVTEGFLDENGGLYFLTEHGPGALLDADLDWALTRMHSGGKPVDDTHIAAALALPTGSVTDITLRFESGEVQLHRLDSAEAPQRLNFVLDPTPGI